MVGVVLVESSSLLQNETCARLSMLERLERATIADKPSPKWLPE